MHPFVVLPDLPPIIFQGKTYARDDLLPVIKQLSETIKYHQRENDSPFVYLVAENHIKSIIAWFAIMQADCSCVLVDPDLKRLELEQLMADTPPAMIIKFSDTGHDLDFSDDLSIRAPDQDHPKPVQKRGYTIVYTAAEDGFAKGALLSVDNLLANATVSSKVNRSGKESRSLALLPFHHTFGLTMGVISPIISQSTIVVGDVRKISAPSKIAELIGVAEITHIYTVPIMLYVLSKERGIDEKFKHLRFIISGGYKLPEMIFDLYRKKFHIDIREGYGLTEASPICSWHYPDEEIRPASVGRYEHYCDMQIIGADGQRLPAGEIGEICIQGANVMEGYLNQPETTAHTLSGGWLHTGDLGYLDTQGYLFLTGLKKRMVHVGGRNVYPDELERMLLSHPNVEHLELSWTDSPLVGAKINARIVLKKRSSDEQKTFMQWAIHNISAFKLPKQWDFV